MYDRLFPETIAAMVGALMLFLLPVNFSKRQFTITWKEAAAGIECGTLILFGGGLAMGGDISQVFFIAVLCVLALLLSKLTSHTAATNMIGSLAITIAVSAG